MTAFPFYIGYDECERSAYEVCSATLKKHASIPLDVFVLDQLPLREDGIYRRTFSVENGQKIDAIDGRPFSTDFSFTRFLVPYLRDYSGWAAFSDCDFLFTADIAELIAMADDNYAVMVVKHDYRPHEQTKMNGQTQQPYRRKLWSSLVLWNCGHWANRALTPEAVNTKTGRWLHGFDWLRDDEIGVLPMEWNWIAGASMPKGIHYSLGTPDMAFSKPDYAELWKDELRELRAARALIGDQARTPERAGELK